jgi:hypothetical protein
MAPATIGGFAGFSPSAVLTLSTYATEMARSSVLAKAHPRPWHRGSVFSDGPRVPLDREQRARFRFLLNAHRRGGRLTPTTELIGNALVRRLGVDGQLDPAHETIAEDAGCCARTVRRALAALKAVGLVLWQCRLMRSGWRVAQTSNSYVLVPGGVGTLPTGPASRCGGQSVRQSLKESFIPMEPLDLTQQEALKGLAAIAATRMQKLGLGGSEQIMQACTSQRQ